MSDALETPQADVDTTEVEGTEPEAPETDEVEGVEGELPTQDEDEADRVEAEATKAELPSWRHKPTVAYVEMVVARREAKGGMSKTAVAKFRKTLLEKHGLPTTKAAQAKHEAQIAAAKKALKADAKATRRAARLEARAAAKAAKS